MPTTLPNDFRESLLDPMDKNTWLWMVQLAVSPESTVYAVGNNEDVTYNGQKYTADNLGVSARAVNSSGSIPTVILRTSSLNSTIYDLVQKTGGADGGTIKLIKVNNDYLSTSIPALEADFESIRCKVDSEWIYFTLGLPNPMSKRIPLRDYSSSICPYATPTLFKKSRCKYTGGDTTCTGTYEDCLTKGNAESWGGFLGLDNSSMEV